nr:unnamed protein product [Callosobruchus analis]
MSNHSEAADSDNLSLCIHCNATFKSKTSLDDHTIREHPGFIASGCTYKTTVKGSFDRHMLKHPETLSICVHCNATYKSKKNLDDHIIRKHPDFIESISSKIHECTHCTYKTTVKGHLTEHMVQHTETADIYKLRCIHCDETFKRRAGLDEHIIKKHPHLIATITSKIQTADNYKLKICVHCNAKFKSKASLDNHTVREHPDFVASVSNKLHECAHCTYKTTLKSNFSKHMWKHSKALRSCAHCDAKFKSKQKLDEHTLKKHPGFITSVSSKMRRCTHCTYITTRKDMFARHMLEHPETADSGQLITCTHCEAKFKSKQKLDEHTLKKHPDLIASVSSKIHECIYCTYKTTRKDVFLRHMEDHPEAELRCLHCEATFKRKTGLDNHVIRKHPHFIASVSSKMHECTYCTYKTTMKSNFAKHLLKHSHKLSKCIHCNAIYKHKIGLDDHILRQHPELIASVSSKMHECTHCAFKTVLKANLALHMLEHSNKLIRCNHCNSTFKSKPALNDHIINRHPDFMASISSKIHQCKYCTYKTTWKSHFARHMLAHPETADSRKLSKCIRCNTEYKHKIGLDEHILRQHPELIASVSNKMHECTHCAFKTVFKDNLTVHMVEHHETADICKFSTCVHCNTTFIDKQALSDHILRKHPGSIGSVSRKYMNVHFVHLKLSQNLIQIVIC